MTSVELKKKRVCTLFVCLTLASIVGVLLCKFVFNNIYYLLLFLGLFLVFFFGGFISVAAYSRAYIAARMAEGISKEQAVALWHKKYPLVDM